MCVLLCMCVFVLLSLHVKSGCGNEYDCDFQANIHLYFFFPFTSCSLPYPNSFMVIMKSCWLSGYQKTAMIILCMLDRLDDMMTDWFCLTLLKIQHVQNRFVHYSGDFYNRKIILHLFDFFFNPDCSLKF